MSLRSLRRVASVLSIAALAAASLPACDRSQAVLPSADGIDALIEQGEYAAAEAGADALAAFARSTSGERTIEYAAAADVLVRALLANGRGASLASLTMAENVLRIKEAQLGHEHQDLVPSLVNLGEVLGERQENERSVVVLERALRLQERQEDSHSGLALARILDRLGLAFVRAGRHDDGVTAIERGLRLKEGMAGDREKARSLEALAGALQDKGDYTAADVPLARALELRRPRDQAHPEYIETLSLLSFQEWTRGRLEEALDAASAAVGLAERVLRQDDPRLARALRLLASAKLDLWDIDGARDLMQRATIVAERSLGPAHPDFAHHLNDLAAATLLLGQYQDARRLYERALAILEARFGDSHNLVATGAYNLARLDADLGDHDRALREYQRAITIWERVLAPDHAFVAQGLAAQALVIREQGRLAEALSLQMRALAIRERNFGSRHRSVARTLSAIAETYNQMGRHAEASRYSERALRIWAAAGNPDDHERAVALGLSADLDLERGDVRAARRAYEQAAGIEERVFGTAHPEFARARMGLARLLARSGEGAPALAGAKVAESIGRAHLRRMLRYLPEREALNYAAVRPRGVDLMLSLVGAAPDAAVSGVDAVIRSRALVLDEMAARRRAASPDPGAGNAALAATLASAQQKLANLEVRGPGSMTPARYGELLDEARRQSELAERRLAEASASYRRERSRAQAGLEQVTASLPPGTVLVSFVRYQQLHLGGVRSSTRLAGTARLASETASYLAFVLRAGRKPEAVKLGPARDVDTLVSKWRADIAAGALGPRMASGEPLVSSRVSGAALRAEVWDPLSRHLDGARHVFIVPDGMLGLVPFAALPVGRDSFVLEQVPPIHYLSAERDVVSMNDARTAAVGMLAIGGPAFDHAPGSPASSSTSAGSAMPLSELRTARTACASLESLRFQPLDGTSQEAQEVSRFWPAALGAARALVGREATEQGFKQQARDYRVLHLATHGFFLDGSCLPESGSAGMRGVGGLSSAKAVENPLRLSGLALAGANRRALAGPDEDDGILTAEEVAMLDLQGVEWAVLSACDTGVGEIKTGEGVFGLRRAFQVAGARTVVMSLWSVDDQATRAWMRALYEGRFQKTLSTADAVHQASLSVLRDRRAKGLSTHPFYWAAFVAAGDWR